jgi:hypothetical protein
MRVNIGYHTSKQIAGTERHENAERLRQVAGARSMARAPLVRSVPPRFTDPAPSLASSLLLAP